MSNMKDVAKYAGVSIATVSKYLNGGNVLAENKIRIKEAIDILDYKVNQMARGLKTSKSGTIGVLIPNLENIFFTKIISNIENILLKNSYSTIVCDYRDNPDLEKEKLEFLINKMVDGIIMVPLNEKKDNLQAVLKEDIPLVMVDRRIEGISCDVVLINNVNASYQAVEHLIKKGHTRIGIICGPKNIFTARERLKGYYQAHQDNHLSIDETLVKYGDYQIESAYQALIKLKQVQNPPTAIFVTNYEMTLGVIMAINELGIKVPTDLSIIGFDNIELARIVKPSLSIVKQPMVAIAQTAAKIILKRLKGEMTDFPQTCYLQTEVIIKDSVRDRR